MLNTPIKTYTRIQSLTITTLLVSPITILSQIILITILSIQDFFINLLLSIQWYVVVQYTLHNILNNILNKCNFLCLILQIKASKSLPIIKIITLGLILFPCFKWVCKIIHRSFIIIVVLWVNLEIEGENLITSETKNVKDNLQIVQVEVNKKKRIKTNKDYKN